MGLIKAFVKGFKEGYNQPDNIERRNKFKASPEVAKFKENMKEFGIVIEKEKQECQLPLP